MSRLPRKLSPAEARAHIYLKRDLPLPVDLWVRLASEGIDVPALVNSYA